MFVLCPHCHFLVGIDPRTGRPPANCPKCGGVVVEPLPDMPAEGAHAEEIAPAAPAPLAPFAPVELPSVLPTLPEAAAGSEQAQDTQAQLEVMVPTPPPAEPNTPKGADAPASVVSAVVEKTTSAPKPRVLLRRKAEPAVTPASATPPAAMPTPPATAPREPKPRWWWWSRRKAEPVVSSAASTPPGTTEGASSEAPVESSRADAMVSALQGRRRTTRKPVATSASPVQPAPVVPAVVVSEVEVDALPPAVRIEDVIAATSADAGIDASAQAPSAPAKRNRRTSAATATDPNQPAPAASIESAAANTPVAVPMDRAPVDSKPSDSMAADSRPADGRPVDSRPVASTIADGAPAAPPVPPHPMRRRTDFDPTAASEPPAVGVPPHPLRRRTDAPSFTRPRARASAASRIGWRSLVAVAGLSVLLVLQLLLAQRDSLAASARWRPMISSVCATLHCSLPPWHEPAAFTMLSRDVRPHPGTPGTLLINASFRNDARWSQPWPRLLLTLSDLDGRMVGARSFAADEYLGAAPTQSALAPGQTAAVTLSVVEPAPNVVAFTFDFR